MKKYYQLINSVSLFSHIPEGDIPPILNCLSARLRSFSKGEIIFAAGQRALSVGIICSGSAHIFSEDFIGNRTILAAVEEGELFGEAFACAQTEHLPVSVIAAQKCDIVFINYRKIMSTCSTNCSFHSRLIANMLNVLAQKNVILNQRLEIISKRSTREKITAYLSVQAAAYGSGKFTIPFDRQALADFLCVDRSAMSAELSKMQREGLLKTNRSQFELFI